MPATSSTFRDPTTNMHGDLLGPAVAPAVSGNWVYVEGYDKISVHLIIVTGPTAFLCGSNKDNPLDSDDGVDLVAAGLVSNITAGTSITASTIAVIKTPLKWLKVKLTGSSGSASAPFVAV